MISEKCSLGRDDRDKGLWRVSWVSGGIGCGGALRGCIMFAESVQILWPLTQKCQSL